MNIKSLTSKFEGDKIVLFVTIVLSLISILAVLSSTPDKILMHLIYIAGSFAVMFLVYRIPNYIVLTRGSNIILFMALLFLLFTIASGRGGDAQAGRGLSIAGHQVQTFYLIGFMVIFYISKFLATRIAKDQELTTQELLWLFGVVCIFCGGMALTNMSTAIILFVTSLVVMFIGKVKFRYLFILVLLGGCVAFIYMKSGLGRGSTFGNRLEYFVTQDNTNGYGDQMVLAKAAIAKSGVLSLPGHGAIKAILPEKETDYVYATVCEELGLLIGFGIIFLYLLLFTRAWIIAGKSKGACGTLLAMGIGFWFTFQALVHIGVNCELLPATGQTLPFISRGGASLLFSGGAIGLLLNISKCNNQEKVNKNN